MKAEARLHALGCRGCRAFKKALKPGETRLVMLESPTNPRMQICDIRTLARISHEVSQCSTVACGNSQAPHKLLKDLLPRRNGFKAAAGRCMGGG